MACAREGRRRQERAALPFPCPCLGAGRGGAAGAPGPRGSQTKRVRSTGGPDPEIGRGGAWPEWWHGCAPSVTVGDADLQIGREVWAHSRARGIPPPGAPSALGKRVSPAHGVCRFVPAGWIMRTRRARGPYPVYLGVRYTDGSCRSRYRIEARPDFENTPGPVGIPDSTRAWPDAAFGCGAHRLFCNGNHPVGLTGAGESPMAGRGAAGCGRSAGRFCPVVNQPH